jgi:hypothetical protein
MSNEVVNIDWVDTVTSRGVRTEPGFEKVAKRRKKLPAETEAHYVCNDCNVNVLTAGEFYVLKQDIWEKQLSLGWTDNLCVGCLEARLGRKITLHDISSFPSYEWMHPPSERLADRFGFVKGKNGKWRKKTRRDNQQPQL